MSKANSFNHVETTFALSRLNPWQEMAVFSVLLLQLSWMVPWYQLLINPASLGPPLQVIVILSGVLLVTYFLSRLLTILRITPRVTQVILCGVLLFWGWLGFKFLHIPNQTTGISIALNRKVENFTDLRYLIPDEFVILVAILFMWRSGINLARYGVRQHGVMGQFRLGAAMLMAYGFITLFSEGELPVYYVFIFLFAGLIGMGTSRVGMISRFRGGARIPFDRNWLGGMFSGTLLVVMAAVVVGVVIGGDFGFGVFDLFFSILNAIAFLLVSPLIFLLEPLTGEIQIEVSTQTPTPTPTLGLITTPSPDPFFISGEAVENAAPLFIEYKTLQAVVLWTILAVLVFLVLRSIRKRVSFRSHEEIPYQEVLGQGSLLDALRALLSNPGKVIADGLRSLRKRYSDRLLAAFRIRRMYAQFLNLCIDLGIPRRAAQTPLEFLPIAVDLMPSNRFDMTMLTEAYLRVRYGSIPENEEEYQAVEEAWKRIRESGRQIIKQRKSGKRSGDE